MRVCIVYDCLYPWTVGGAERWYRLLAERLAAAGHDVTYLTLRQWNRGEAPAIPGVRVVAAGPRMALYAGGRRGILPPLAFGAGTLAHLARHGRRYDVVACASFPFFSTLAAGLLKRHGGYRLVVDWWEVWSAGYWRDYLGPVGGRIGHAVQRACARMPHVARAGSRLHASRLAGEGHRGSPLPIGGIADHAPDVAREPDPAEPCVVFLGRHTSDKGVQHVVPALAAARGTIPDLRAVILGDGPLREAVLRQAGAAGLADAVDLPGFVSEAELDRAVRRALCLVLPSRREGFGLAVLDAASRGVPSVVVRGPDNAATELLEPGINGVVALSASPEDLADAILSIHRAGFPLRERTARWWAANASRLSAEDGLRRALLAYGSDRAPDDPRPESSSRDRAALPVTHGDR